jgi:hypothetical protein
MTAAPGFLIIDARPAPPGKKKPDGLLGVLRAPVSPAAGAS